MNSVEHVSHSSSVPRPTTTAPIPVDDVEEGEEDENDDNQNSSTPLLTAKSF